MIKAIIADDEQDAVNYLKKSLKECCLNLEIIATAQNVKETENLILSLHPDLVLLDINMPGGSVFEMLDRLKPITFEVIFVTAYNQYAIQALKRNAIDYLLKPININELKEAIGKVEIKKTEALNKKNIEELIRELTKQNKIAITTFERTIYLKISDIIRFEGDGNYVRIITTTGENYLVSKKIKDYQELLPNYPFYRVHNSYIINVDHIKSILNKDSAIIMSDNTVIPVSRKKREEFLELMASYCKY